MHFQPAQHKTKFLSSDPSWGRASHAGYLVRARLDERSVVPKFVLYFTYCVTYRDWIFSSFIQATIQNVSAERYVISFLFL